MKLKGIELNGTYKITYYKTDFVVCDKKGNVIYSEGDNGYWEKREYDRRGNRTYYEDSYGYWSKSEYNGEGKRIYFKGNNGNGFWLKREYDEKGNQIYFENSEGIIIDERAKDGERAKELTIEQIEKLLGYKIKIKGERK